MEHLTAAKHYCLKRTVCFSVLVLSSACSSESDSVGTQGSTRLAAQGPTHAKEKEPEAGPPAVHAEEPPSVVEDPTKGPKVSHASAYDVSSDLFVVHEWGTLTSVVASDGHMLPGLHHEDEDLPGFVADRMAHARQNPTSVKQKMETPVTYFYSPKARSVAVSVSFPKGAFTQWFPYARKTLPDLYLSDPMDPTSVIDPWISSAAPLMATCEARIDAGVDDGLLDWGTVDVLASDALPALPGPLQDTTWQFARQTKSNPLRVRLEQKEYHEKFLFYRGTGNFKLPVVATTTSAGVLINNTDPAQSMHSAFLLNVTPNGAGFAALGDLPPGATAPLSEIPTPSMPHMSFSAALGKALVQALVADGLFDDEAHAMVQTWQRSYFLTPGVRILYLLPQSHTERIIPLKVTPAPDRMLRTMVIRVELTTPALEQQIDAALKRLAAPATHDAARLELLAHGRFAEPYLSGALDRVVDVAQKDAGRTLLIEVRAKRRWRAAGAE